MRKLSRGGAVSSVDSYKMVEPAIVEAVARGRNASRAVRSYLEALEHNRPRRGRKRTPKTVQRQLDEVNAEMENTSGVRRLELIQRQIDLSNELASMSQTVDIGALEQAFVDHAAVCASAKGISYNAFRSFGVPSPVLREAGYTAEFRRPRR